MCNWEIRTNFVASFTFKIVCMKKIGLFFPAFLFFMLVGCVESKQERYLRAARELNAQCPMQLDAYTAIDSMVYTPAVHSLTYYYRVSNVADSVLLQQREQLEVELWKGILNSTEMLPYIEDKVTFCYCYRTDSTDCLLDFTFTPDYFVEGKAVE